MTFGQSIKTCFRKYAVFKGRACRSEFWWFTLFTFLVSIALDFLLGLFMIPLIFKGQFNAESINSVSTPFYIVSLVVGLALLLPTLGVLVRRLHDRDKSGWWVGILYIVEAIFVALSLVAGLTLFAIGENPANTADDIPFGMLFLVALLAILLFAYAILLLVWCCQRGTIGYNKYGPDPLAAEEENVVDVELKNLN
ncbi:MAG: DUF805 domain-containing protein [Bacteroidaceae bacterium]|jgi:uncharacterized membrane protein YhaH (DUF805 family)|nr:DUF805 domain-containing protein [Bacteroidaceae bacterium]